MAQLRVMVISDPHASGTELTPANTNGRVDSKGTEIFNQALEITYQAKPDLLLITSDLTYSGEASSHSHITGMLKELEKSNIPVLVLPGKNDISNTNSLDDNHKTISAAEFKTNYAQFGYSNTDTHIENTSFEPNSLSWSAVLANSNLGIVAIDAEMSSDVSSTTQWATSQISSLKQSGKMVIALTQKPVLNHFTSQTTLDNSVKEALAGADYVVCGNALVQHTKTEGQTTEIASGSLTLYPCWMQMLKIDTSAKSITTTSTMVQKEFNGQDLQEIALTECQTKAQALISDINATIANAYYELYDGTEVAVLSGEWTFKSLTYTRTFNNIQWQPLFVPFSIAFDNTDSDFNSLFDVAIPDYADADKVGFTQINSGEPMLNANSVALISLKPNTPTGQYSVKLATNKLVPEPTNNTSNPITISSYILTGTYKPVTGDMMHDNALYALSGGYLKTVAESVDGSDKIYLKPMRWYLSLESTSSTSSQFSLVVNKDDETGISQAITPAQAAGAIYTLQGIKVSESALSKGIYIKNGKKIIVK